MWEGIYSEAEDCQMVYTGAGCGGKHINYPCITEQSWLQGQCGQQNWGAFSQNKTKISKWKKEYEISPPINFISLILKIKMV